MFYLFPRPRLRFFRVEGKRVSDNQITVLRDEPITFFKVVLFSAICTFH